MCLVARMLLMKDVKVLAHRIARGAQPGDFFEDGYSADTMVAIMSSDAFRALVRDEQARMRREVLDDA